MYIYIYIYLICIHNMYIDAGGGRLLRPAGVRPRRGRRVRHGASTLVLVI